jgi:hypothetical protein
MIPKSGYRFSGKIMRNVKELPATRAGVAQLVRALVCGTRGRWFKSTRLYHSLPAAISAVHCANKNAGDVIAGVGFLNRSAV